MITWKAERVGMVMMTKKGHHFFEEKNRVTSSVTAAGDTDVSDATDDILYFAKREPCLWLTKMRRAVLQLVRIRR